MQRFRLGLCQLGVGSVKAANLEAASAAVAEAADDGADLVVLPECFNSPYGTSFFPEYAEPLSPGNQTYDALVAMAVDAGVVLVGGSVPEKGDDGNLYNTSLVFDAQGNELGRHRKVYTTTHTITITITITHTLIHMPDGLTCEIVGPFV